MSCNYVTSQISQKQTHVFLVLQLSSRTYCNVALNHIHSEITPSTFSESLTFLIKFYSMIYRSSLLPVFIDFSCIFLIMIIAMKCQ